MSCKPNRRSGEKRGGRLMPMPRKTGWEAEFIGLMRAGYSRTEAAGRVGISIPTVQGRIQRNAALADAVRAATIAAGPGGIHADEDFDDNCCRRTCARLGIWYAGGRAYCDSHWGVLRSNTRRTAAAARARAVRHAGGRRLWVTSKNASPASTCKPSASRAISSRAFASPAGGQKKERISKRCRRLQRRDESAPKKNTSAENNPPPTCGQEEQDHVHSLTASSKRCMTSATSNGGSARAT